MTSTGAERRTEPLDSEQLAGAGAVEQDAQGGDIALRADLLLLDDDSRDHSVQGRVGEAGRLLDRAAVGLGPERLPALLLRLRASPPRAPCRHLSALTSTSIPVISKVLALSIGGTPRSAPSSCAQTARPPASEASKATNRRGRRRVSFTPAFWRVGRGNPSAMWPARPGRLLRESQLRSRRSPDQKALASNPVALPSEWSRRRRSNG